MKYVFYTLIALIAWLPAHAQPASTTIQKPVAAQEPQAAQSVRLLAQNSDSGTAGSPDHMEGEQSQPAQLLVGYALNVDGLLLGLDNQMRTVSEKVEAGELTQLEAVVLKLELTRAMIARLETVSAVYDSLIFRDAGGEAAPENAPATSTPAPALQIKRTISVHELMQENAQ